MRIQSIYDKLAKYSRIAEEKKANTTLSKCKYDFSKKTKHWKFAKYNVKLSLIDEIEQEYEYLDEAVGIASYYGYERFEELDEKYTDFKMEIAGEVDNMAVNSSVRYVKEGTEKLGEMLAKVKELAEELGMPASEIYDNYDEAFNLFSNAPEVYSDFLSEYKKFTAYVGLGDFL